MPELTPSADRPDRPDETAIDPTMVAKAKAEAAALRDNLTSAPDTRTEPTPMSDDHLEGLRAYWDGSHTAGGRDVRRLLAEVGRLKAEHWNAFGIRHLAAERDKYDAEEITVNNENFRRGDLRHVLARVMESRDEYAREAKEARAEAERLYTRANELATNNSYLAGIRVHKETAERERDEARAITDQVRNELAAARRETESIRKAYGIVNDANERNSAKVYQLIDEQHDARAVQIKHLADWLTEHTSEPQGPFGAVEAAIHAIEERDGKLAAVRKIEPTMRHIYASGNRTEREVIDVVDELIGQALNPGDALEEQWKAAKTPPPTLVDPVKCDACKGSGQSGKYSQPAGMPFADYGPEPCADCDGTGHVTNPAHDERAEDTTMADPEPNYIDIRTEGASVPWMRQAYIKRATETPEETAARESWRWDGPSGKLFGLAVAHDGPGDTERLNLDQAATALYDWTTQLRQNKRGPWPTGRIEVIQGIEAAAGWLKTRAAYERDVREQRAADLKRSLDSVTYSVREVARVWKDAFATARAEREAKAEPTWRDVIRAMWHAGIRFSLRTGDVWDLHTFDGEWIGSVTHPRPSVWRIELVTEDTTVRIHDAEPERVLQQATDLGLIGGGTDA